jgi:RNA polymerase sigma-70 factor, ECF subfamily
MHPPEHPEVRAASPDLTMLLKLYVERFNRRDWDGLRELISADARLQVADRFAGQLANSPYFGQYERLATPWRMAAGRVDGESVVLSLCQDKNTWIVQSFVRLAASKARVVDIVDYAHCPWVLSAASHVEIL